MIEKEYLIKGYPRGDGHYTEFGKVTAKSKEDALIKFQKSIWYEYHAEEFNQEKYDKLKNSNNTREIK